MLVTNESLLDWVQKRCSFCLSHLNTHYLLCIKAECIFKKDIVTDIEQTKSLFGLLVCILVPHSEFKTGGGQRSQQDIVKSHLGRQITCKHAPTPTSQHMRRWMKESLPFEVSLSCFQGFRQLGRGSWWSAQHGPRDAWLQLWQMWSLLRHTWLKQQQQHTNEPCVYTTCSLICNTLIWKHNTTC